MGTQAGLLREEGLFVEPAGATAYAGVLADARSGAFSVDDEVVAVATGIGFKDPRSHRQRADRNNRGKSDIAAVMKAALARASTHPGH